MSRATSVSRGRALGSRAGWTLADQLVSSATNAVLSVLVARSVDVHEFGSFSLAFIVFAFAVGLVRALVTDPLTIRYSHGDPEALRAASGKAAGASLVLGVLLGLGCALASVPASGLTAATFLTLAVVLPGLLVQDAWRRAFFAAGRPAAAFVNDTVWAVLQIGGVVVLIELGVETVVALVLVWGGAAAAAAVFGSWQLKTFADPRAGVPWAWSQRSLGARFGLDFLISQGAFNAAMALIAVVAGLAATGALRAAQVLLGPVQVLALALTSFALPLLAARSTNPPDVRRLALVLSGGVTACTIAYVGLLLLLPSRLGHQLLGDSWTGARETLPLLGLQTVLIAVVIGATVSLKALGRGTSLLRLTVIQAPILLGGSLLGAHLGGARGAALGFVVAHVVGTALGWLALWRATARSHAAVVDG